MEKVDPGETAWELVAMRTRRRGWKNVGSAVVKNRPLETAGRGDVAVFLARPALRQSATDRYAR
jgi:hypothetical protein